MKVTERVKEDKWAKSKVFWFHLPFIWHKGPPIFRVGLLASNNLIQKILHSCFWQLVFQLIQDVVKLTKCIVTAGSHLSLGIHLNPSNNTSKSICSQEYFLNCCFTLYLGCCQTLPEGFPQTKNPLLLKIIDSPTVGFPSQSHCWKWVTGPKLSSASGRWEPQHCSPRVGCKTGSFFYHCYRLENEPLLCRIT